MRLSYMYSLLAALPTLALAVPTQKTQNNGQGNEEIQWKPCNFSDTVPGECGKMMVPLDYTEDDGEELAISLRRVPAAKRPRKGSIFFNFGGPGPSGVADLAAYAPRLMAATGGHHDLVLVLPRGAKGTLEFSCFPDEIQRGAYTFSISGNSSAYAAEEIWARSKIFDSNCAVAQKETGQLIGTAFTARDHMRVVDALEEDGMLRYWGFSYGTVLGSTLVGMFPDKIDKVILDGVANIHEYYQNNEVELMASTDDTFRGFCKGCVAAPERCPLAGNMTAEQLEQSLYAMMEDLKENPIPVIDKELPGGGMLIDYSLVKGIFFKMLYFPFTWPATAAAIAGVAAGSADALMGLGAGGEGGNEAQFGIKCGDVLQHADKLADIKPILEARHKLSWFGDAADQVLAQCARWKLPAKERFDGDFSKVKSKNPILVVNNRHDPVTPLASARNVSETFEGSVLLEQNNYGHTSMVQGSLCTAKAIWSYFTEGKLPKKGTVCDDFKPPVFSNQTGWDEITKELTGMSTDK